MAGRRERDSEQDKKLFIGGLHYETTESNLRDFYGKWGEVVDCVVMMDPHTKRSRGFGFVTYRDDESLDDALNSRPHLIGGKEVEPKRATPRESTRGGDTRGAVKKVFVGGISQDTDEEHLREYFSKYGRIESTSVMTDRDTGKSRGFGFVIFEDFDAVDQCCGSSYGSRYHEINGRKCEVKRAVPRQDDSLQRSRDSGRSRSSHGEDLRSSYRSGGRPSSYSPSPYSGSVGYGSSAYNSYAAAYASAYPGYSASSWGSSDPYGAGGYGSSGLGSGYGSSYSGGPMRSSSYSSKYAGPYGGGYGSGAGYSSSSYAVDPYEGSSKAYPGSSSAYGSRSSAYGHGASDSNPYGGY